MKVVIGSSSGFHFTISGMPQKFLTYDTKNSQFPTTVHFPMDIVQYLQQVSEGLWTGRVI